MFALRISLSLGAALLTLLAGRGVAIASQSSSFRIEGESISETVPSTLQSSGFRLSEVGVESQASILSSANFKLSAGPVAVVSGSIAESASTTNEAVSAQSGGGSRRTRPTVTLSTIEAPQSITNRETEMVVDESLPLVDLPPPTLSRRVALEALLAARTPAESGVQPRKVIAQPTLRPPSPSEIDLSPLIALSTKRRMIARAPLEFQDSWHRPHSIDFLGAEIAEAYEAYAEARSVRISRVVDLINQNLLLSSLLVFAAVALSVLSTSGSFRRRCTTIVCVLERQIASVQPKMGYARLLLRIFLLVFSLGIFFWLTTAYAFAATTAPLRHIYNGRLLNSAGTALTTSHSIRFSYWTSGDYVTSDTTGAGAIDTAASTYAGWNEAHTVTPNSDGYFSVELGSITALPTMDSLSAATLLSLFLQVEVKVATASDTSYELLDRDTSSTTIDRSQVFSVPFALNADMLDQREVGTASGSIPLFESGGVLAKAGIPSGLTRDIFTIDSDDTASEPTLRFGEVLAKTLSYSSGAFRFNDDLLIAGSLTVDQDSATGTGILVDSEALNAPAVAIDIQGSSTSPHILFGSGGTFDTALFRETANTLRLSGSFRIADTLSGTALRADRSLASSGALSIAGATNLQSTLEINGTTTLRSTLSGASAVTLSSLKNCTGLGTDVNGILSCATTPLLARKAADETVNNSTTLQDDDALKFTIGANEVWAFTVHIVGQSGTSPDFKYALTAPTGSTCAYSVNAEENASASSHVVCAEPSARMPANGINEAFFINGTVMAGATNGTVTVQWSQFTQSASDSIVRAGSWLVAHRIQ